MKFGFQKISVRLSLFFMLILFFSVSLFSGIIVLAVSNYVRKNQSELLKDSQEIIIRTFVSNFQLYEESKEFYFEIPYNITFSIYDTVTKKVLYTNDPMLPLLENSRGVSKKYFAKDYFSDGDLNILYTAASLSHENLSFTVVTALDIDSDYASQIFRTIPRIAIFALLPLLMVSFAVSVIITTKMTEPFEREKQFSNDVSHELKTPLSIINGHVSLLLRWGKSDPKLLEESLQSVKKETRSMQKTIENLLQISRYENRRAKPEACEFSVMDFYSRLQNEFSVAESEKAEPSSSKIIITLEKDFQMNSDQEMLHQIFTALISNSLKYNPGGCTIKLNGTKKGKTVILEEEDDGIGLDKKIIPFIFDRFYRGDSSHSQNIPGSGLGLSISRTLVKALNGKISAQNAAPKGALFRIELKS